MLEKPNGNLVSGQKPILDYCKEYFSDVYTSSATSEADGCINVASYLGSACCLQLTEDDRISCEGPISSVRCKFALDVILNNNHQFQDFQFQRHQFQDFQKSFCRFLTGYHCNF